jgi:hypothetical protein
LSAWKYGPVVRAIGRVVWAVALGFFLTRVLDIVCHYLWYYVVPGELIESFHLGVFGDRFNGEFLHPEVPKAEDFPFWSAPGVALAAFGMSTFLRRSLAGSILMGGGLVLAWSVLCGNPGEYGWSSPGRIDLVWAIAAATGAAVPPLLRRRRHRVCPPSGGVAADRLTAPKSGANPDR